jgi:N-acetylneuraminic acid mutarotase
MLRILIILLTLTPICAFAQNTWSPKDSVNGAPRAVSSSFVLNNEAYIVAGLDEDGFRRKMYSYNFLQDDWDLEKSLGGINGAGLNRGSACAFSVGFKAYVCLGQGVTNVFFKDNWEYDLVNETWSQKSDFIGEARRQAVAFVIDDIAYLGTGIAASGLKKDMYSYDPETNTWTQLVDFPGSARKEAAAFAMGGQGYLGTGDDGVMKNDFWQFEPSTGAWTQKSNMPGLPRKGAVGWGIFPNAYICTGEDNTFNYSTDLWEYNFWLDTWTQQPSIPGPGRSNAVAFVLNGLGFVGTGYNGIFLDDLYAFTPTLSTGIELKKEDVSIYPIPASDHVTIDVDIQDVELILLGMDGKQLSSDKYVVKTNSGFIVQRNDLSIGNYFFQLIQAGNLVYSHKILFN